LRSAVEIAPPIALSRVERVAGTDAPEVSATNRTGICIVAASAPESATAKEVVTVIGLWLRYARMPRMIASPKPDVETSVAPGIWRARSYVTVRDLIAFSIPCTMSAPASLQPM
jgi:hypothetical protein